MSWDVVRDESKQAICACGKGHVISRTYYEVDDWNRSHASSFIKIDCPDCSLNYHIETVNRFCCCGSYLVPIGLSLCDGSQSNDFLYNVISNFTTEQIRNVIDDMELYPYAMVVDLQESRDIIALHRGLNFGTLLPIIDKLKYCLSHYEEIKQGLSSVNVVISKSVKLEFE